MKQTLKIFTRFNSRADNKVVFNPYWKCRRDYDSYPDTAVSRYTIITDP